MKEVIVSFPVKIKKFKEHAMLKSTLLSLINDQKEFQRLQSPGNDITRCDWPTSRFDTEREWLKVLRPSLMEHLADWVGSINYDGFHIDEIWFQQYTKNSQHGWHIHGGNMTNVYYLDIQHDNPKTEWIDILTGKIYTFDIEEGDIITFPSYLKHRAPKNNSTTTKTIISWNLNLSLNDGYGE